MDATTIDYTGIIAAVLAILGVVGNYLRVSGRTKYLTAITDILDLMTDFVAWGKMAVAASCGEKVDGEAFKASTEEIERHIAQIKKDLGQ
jgi:hypothetical protein